ncbi:MAG: diphthine--ammonia ligase [Candidatus Anstonellales archaeon]
MRTCVFYSGGKDSYYALQLAILNAQDLYVLTILPEEEYDDIYHYPNVKFTTLQLKQLGIPEGRHFFIKRAEDKIAGFLYKKKIEMIYTGGIQSDYQRFYFYGIANELGIAIRNPLWLKYEISGNYYNELRSYIKVIFTRLSAMGLEEDLLGKVVDFNLLANRITRNKLNIHPLFEGGEAETFVLDSPFFRNSLELSEYEVLKEKQSYTLLIKSLKEVPKEETKNI